MTTTMDEQAHAPMPGPQAAPTAGAAAAAPHVIEVPGWPPGPNSRLHPLVRYKQCKPLAQAVGWQARALHVPAPYAYARVEVTFCFCRLSEVQDVDNLYARCKPLVDALKGILLVNDDPAHCDLVVQQRKMPLPGKKKLVRLAITPLPQAQPQPQREGERPHG